uniref:Sodium/calcium exchanger membrane region domain-containing protein n=1 Tax=Zooxanthella nutricula TaxID=1333877 RepID=A0A6U6P4V1_9DINO
MSASGLHFQTAGYVLPASAGKPNLLAYPESPGPNSPGPTWPPNDDPKLDALAKLEMEENFSSDDSELATSAGSKKVHDDACADGFGPYLVRTCTEMFCNSRLNILLLCTPLCLLSDMLHWGKGATFCLAILALIPWGERISWVTEDWAKYTNETAGGLFLASVGNLTEIIFCLNALQGGLLRVVQVSMLGSVLSNLLLVLGCAFVVGGTRWDEQSFNKVAAVTNSGLLVVAVLALSLPSILDATHTGTGEADVAENITRAGLTAEGASYSLHLQGGGAPLWLSRFIATLLIILYCMLIYFQFVTHTHLFQDADDEDEPGVLGFYGGMFWMTFITYFIWILSDTVVDALVDASTQLGVPVLFLSGIIMPIVGNAVEHASAVIFAMHNKMEISLGVAVGSAVQISIFVIPLNVLLGSAMHEPMTLNFHIFETTVLLVTTMGVAFAVSDGKSHWLKGMTLIFAYLMIAAAFWAHSEPDLTQSVASTG